jgi:putative FmdB family regulatory protein
MPTYEFRHDPQECKHEWEEFLSMSAPNPTHCPKCGAEGNITKLISGGSGKGIVELSGQDLVDSVKSGAKQLGRDAMRNENTYANLLGNDRYESLQTQIDRNKR